MAAAAAAAEPRRGHGGRGALNVLKRKNDDGDAVVGARALSAVLAVSDGNREPTSNSCSRAFSRTPIPRTIRRPS